MTLFSVCGRPATPVHFFVSQYLDCHNKFENRFVFHDTEIDRHICNARFVLLNRLSAQCQNDRLSLGITTHMHMKPFCSVHCVKQSPGIDHIARSVLPCCLSSCCCPLNRDFKSRKSNRRICAHRVRHRAALVVVLSRFLVVRPRFGRPAAVDYLVMTISDSPRARAL
jgi:hypothetical protein